jgi:hypothetical protein
MNFNDMPGIVNGRGNPVGPDLSRPAPIYRPQETQRLIITYPLERFLIKNFIAYFSAESFFQWMSETGHVSPQTAAKCYTETMSCMKE